jgi:hypothetical protein
MKNTVRPFWPAAAQPSSAAEAKNDSTVSPIKLALLDDPTAEDRGYNPYDIYDTGNTSDVWRFKRKRA